MSIRDLDMYEKFPNPNPGDSDLLNLRFRLYTCVQEVLQVVMLCFNNNNSGAQIA
jgi:hypothetical protein